MLKERWDRLNPNVKRVVVGGGIAAALLAMIYTGNNTIKEPERRRNAQQVIKSVLTDTDPRDVGVDAMAAQIDLMRRQMDDQTRTIAALRREMDIAKHTAPPDSEGVKLMGKSLDELRRQFAEMQRQRDRERLEAVRAPGDAKQAGDGTAAPNGGDGPGGKSVAAPGSAMPVSTGGDLPPGGGEPPNANQSIDLSKPPAPSDIFRGVRAPAPNGERDVLGNSPRSSIPGTAGPAPGALAGAELAGAATTAPSSARVKIVHYSEKIATAEVKDEASDNVLAAGDSVPVPAGSILSGTLLTGMDAPTGRSAKKDPFPALLRLKLEAILPNRFMLDVRDCFVLMGGYGDLSSERAYLRAETISCVRNDGHIVETRLEGYATGQDGKSGIRGRLVSKQGQLIGRALMAGFMEGVSKAFDVKPVPVLQTGSSVSRTQYQSNFSDQSFQSAAVSGASSALDRIAQFYIDLAEETQPVIEIDAGRAVDIIVTRGAKLDFKSRSGGVPASGSATERDSGRQLPGAGSLFPQQNPGDPGSPPVPAVPHRTLRNVRERPSATG